jgi:hypothetical protein
MRTLLFPQGLLAQWQTLIDDKRLFSQAVGLAQTGAAFVGGSAIRTAPGRTSADSPVGIDARENNTISRCLRPIRVRTAPGRTSADSPVGIDARENNTISRCLRPIREQRFRPNRNSA